MAEDHADNRTDKSTWTWTPNISYGPFIFGTDVSNTPHVGRIVSTRDMGSGEESVGYRTTIDDQTELGFWNDRLVSVDSDRSFFYKGTECIFNDFAVIRHLFDCEFVVDNRYLIFAECEELNLLITMEPDWTITSISVGVDPEIYFPYPHSVDYK